MPKKEVPKYGVVEQIRFVGVKGLDPYNRVSAMRISRNYYEKIRRDINNLITLVVNVKSYSKTGGKAKYSIHVQCIAPTRSFASCKAHDWDLSKALHKAFRDVRMQIKKRLKTDVTKPRTYSAKDL